MSERTAVGLAATLECDVCVVGVGSGGFGAALAAARNGADVVAIERNQVVGGTTTMARVHIWEPVAGAEGIPREMWERMGQLPGGAEDKPYDLAQPGWFQVPQEPEWPHCRSLAFEPWAYDYVAREMLAETGRCRLLLDTTFVDVDVAQGQVRAILARHRGRRLVIRAKTYIDCTADGHLCAQAGCDYHLGEDPRSRYDESLGPEEAEPNLNPMSLLYRLRDTGERQEPWLPSDTPPGYCTHGASLRVLPNGDMSVNRCGMLPGNPLDVAAWPELLREALRRVYAHIHWMQTENGYETWQLVSIAPEIGVRETRRIVGEYMLRQADIMAGVERQDHPDIIAVADHTLDMHGPKHFDTPPPAGAYGVPFRCLLPLGSDNLLIACRAAGFSHVAASSCRLSRTMIKLGEAAGTAAAIGADEGLPARAVEMEGLKKKLAAQSRGEW